MAQGMVEYGILVALIAGLLGNRHAGPPL